MVTVENARDNPMEGLRRIKEVGCYGYNKIIIRHEMTSEVISQACNRRPACLSQVIFSWILIE